MKILVIGSGGREHALAWKLKQSPKVEKIYCAPGNAGIGLIAECVPLKVDDFKGLADFVRRESIGLTVVGPEIPLAGGIVDYFRERSFAIFGPDKKAARLEASKAFAKDFMRKHGVPTAGYRNFTDLSAALEYVRNWPKGRALVVKADGLAAGKGVIICPDGAAAVMAVEQIMKDKVFGASGNEVVVEEFLEGEETSIQIFLDGTHYHMMMPSQDHKRALDNDQGPNTGGMGAYAPAPVVDAALKKKVEESVILPIIKGLKKEGIDYKGALYIGLMISQGQPYVLEFNCRFGDPETQVVLPLLKSDLVEIMEQINNEKLDKMQIEWYNKTAVCVVLASQGYPGDYEKGKTINGLANAEKIPDVTVFHAGTAVGAHGSICTSGGRVLGVTALGDGISATIKKVYAAVATISFDGMHYRKDIGHKALARK